MPAGGNRAGVSARKRQSGSSVRARIVDLIRTVATYCGSSALSDFEPSGRPEGIWEECVSCTGNVDLRESSRYRQPAIAGAAMPWQSLSWCVGMILSEPDQQYRNAVFASGVQARAFRCGFAPGSASIDSGQQMIQAAMPCSSPDPRWRVSCREPSPRPCRLERKDERWHGGMDTAGEQAGRGTGA